MERLGPIARKVLQAAKRAMEARKDGLDRREGSNEFEPEPSREGMAQDSGIRERCTERGLELYAGEFVGLRDPMNATMRSPATNADTYRYDFTSAGLAVRFEKQRPGNARWFDLRAVPRRAWLGWGDPLPRPSSRLHANDNVRHAALDCSISSRVARRESVSIAQYTMP